jgi:alanine racemase
LIYINKIITAIAFGIYIYVVNLIVNIKNAKQNIQTIKSRTGVPIYAVVKADAYGHGMELCRHIQHLVDGFAVSCESEATQLLDANISKKILILCPSKRISAKNIIYTVTSIGDLADKKGEKIAIKINTGMNRLGVLPQKFKQLVSAANNQNCEIKDVFTHFSSAFSAADQFELFQKTIDKTFSEEEKQQICFHTLASNCMILPSTMRLDAVRCGLAIYGYSHGDLFPVLRAYTTINQINHIKKGERVGYGNVFAPKDMVVATLAAGYADGLKRTSGKKVEINGHLCDIVGNICMDMCMADITQIAAKKEDKAFLLSDQYTADDIAAADNTINYEVLTGLSRKRTKIIYC